MQRSAPIAAAAVLGIALAVGVATPAQAATYDVVPAAPGSDYSVQGELTELGGMLYFPATVGVRPITLWRLDPATSVAAPVAAAQEGEFANPTLAVAGDGVLWFIADSAGQGERSTLFAYDPATDAATAYEGTGAPVDELAVVDDVPYTVDGAALIYVHDVSDPTAPPTAIAPVACRNGADYTGVMNIATIGDRLAFAGSCGADGAELFVYDPASGTTTNAYVGTVLPAGADLGSPGAITLIGGQLYFGAGELATDRRLYRYDPAAAEIVSVDPSTSNSGRPFVFEGAVTWLPYDSIRQPVIVQLIDGAATRLPISTYGGLLAPLGEAPWNGRVLVNGFYNDIGGGDATVFVYDPADGAFTRVATGGGAFPTPLVASDGTGYFAAQDGRNVVIFRISVAAPPAPPSPSPSPSATTVPELPATGFASGPAVLVASALAVCFGVGGLLLIRRGARSRR